MGEYQLNFPDDPRMAELLAQQVLTAANVMVSFDDNRRPVQIVVALEQVVPPVPGLHEAAFAAGILVPRSIAANT